MLNCLDCLSPSPRTLQVIVNASLGSSFQYISIVSIFRSIAKLLSCYHLCFFARNYVELQAAYEVHVRLSMYIAYL
jgi:hypothetical protein